MSDLKPNMTEIVKHLELLRCDVHGEYPKFILTDSDLSIKDPCCDEFQIIIQNELKEKVKQDVTLKTK